MQKLWSDLTGKASEAHTAVWCLVEQPNSAPALLQERLKPVKVEANIARLIADLDSNQFPVRQQAAQQLDRLGELADPALRHALANKPSLEKQRRLEQILGTRPENSHPNGCATCVPFTPWSKSVRPKPAACWRQSPRELPGARLTREAKASLERLTQRPLNQTLPQLPHRRDRNAEMQEVRFKPGANFLRLSGPGRRMFPLQKESHFGCGISGLARLI